MITKIWEINWIKTIFIDEDGKIIGKHNNEMFITLGHLGPIFMIEIWDKHEEHIIATICGKSTIRYIKKVQLTDFGGLLVLNVITK